MRKVFLSSTYEDIKGERALAKYILTLIRRGGGPKPLFFEQFLGTPGSTMTNEVVSHCLATAADATEVILILRYRAGYQIESFSNRFSSYVDKIQKLVGKDNPRILGVWELLPAAWQYPPVTWVETFIVWSKIESGQDFNAPVVLAIVDAELTQMADAYKKTFLSDAVDKDKLLEFFGNNIYKVFAQQNGKPNGSDDWLWRLVWLCEFVNWLRDKAKIPVKDLGKINTYEQIATYIEDRYPGYSRMLDSGTFWVQDDDELHEILSNLKAEFEGEVWVWNNDLQYLANKSSFKAIYMPLVGAVREVKVIVRKSRWANLKKERKQQIRRNLAKLPNKSRNKIKLRRIEDNQVDEDITVTLFGVESYLTEEPMILMRPITPGEEPPRFLNLALPSNPTNKALIDHYRRNLKPKFDSDQDFIILYELVQDDGPGSC